MSEFSHTEHPHLKKNLPPTLKDFLQLSQSFESLSHYDPRNIQTLASDTIRAETTPRSKKATEQAIKERAVTLQEQLTSAHTNLSRALTTLTLQADLQGELSKTTNLESVSYQIAYDHAFELLESFNEQYIQKCAIEECDKDASGKRSRDVAWSLSSHSPDNEAQGNAWNELIEQLERLPGPHHTALQEYLKSPTANTILNLIKSYHSFYPTHSRIDISYAIADLAHLQALITDANNLSTSILTKYPLDPSVAITIFEQPVLRSQPTTATERPPTTERHTYIEFPPNYQELKQLFGQNFLGIEEIDRVFTIPPQNQQGQDADTALDQLSDLNALARTQRNQPQETHLFSFTPEIQRRALELLTQKLAEPDVAQLIQKIRSGEIPRDMFMLVLRRGQFSDGTPVTMQSLQQKLEPTLQSEQKGKLIYNPQPNQPYYTNPDQDIISKNNMEWVFVTKDVIPETLGKKNAVQTRVLEQEARKLGLTSHRRSKGWEVVSDFVAPLRLHNIRFFTDPYRYDRTSDETSVGGPVGVGDGSAGGLGVGDWDDAYPMVGSRLSR